MFKKPQQNKSNTNIAEFFLSFVTKDQLLIINDIVTIYILVRKKRLNESHHYKLYVHGSVHRNINLIERTNKMQPCSKIYYSNVS